MPADYILMFLASGQPICFFRGAPRASFCTKPFITFTHCSPQDWWKRSWSKGGIWCEWGWKYFGWELVGCIHGSYESPNTSTFQQFPTLQRANSWCSAAVSGKAFGRSTSGASVKASVECQPEHLLKAALMDYHQEQDVSWIYYKEDKEFTQSLLQEGTAFRRTRPSLLSKGNTQYRSAQGSWGINSAAAVLRSSQALQNWSADWVTAVPGCIPPQHHGLP